MARRKQGEGSRRSQGEWRSWLAKFGSSELGIAAFCEREAISAARLYRWRSLLGNEGDSGEVVGSATAPGFVDLGTLNAGLPRRPGIDLTLELDDGLTLHLVRSGCSFPKARCACMSMVAPSTCANPTLASTP